MSRSFFLSSNSQKKQTLRKTRSQKQRNSLLTHYSFINNRNIYNYSYDVFLPVYEYGCNLRFQTKNLPYVDRYYFCFEDYIRHDNGYSEEEEKELLMNLGGVLLAVDGVDVEGESLQDIRCLILYKHHQMVQLTFLNKNWFYKFDRYSVQVADDKPKNRCAKYGIVDSYCFI